MVSTMLGDAKLEVREVAAVTLAGLLKGVAPHQAQHFALQEVDGRTLRTATMMEMMIWGVAGGPAKTMVDALQALQAGVARL